MFRVLAVLALCLTAPLSAQRTIAVDNDQVRVLVVTDKSTAKGRVHEHSMNRVMIYLDRGAQRLEYTDGRVVDLRFNPGDALWSAAGGMHTSQNVGGTSFRVVEVELKNRGGDVRYPPLDAIRISPDIYKISIENLQVRVARGRVGPGAKIPLHEHSLNRVLVFLTDAQARITAKDGTPAEVAAKAGEVRWASPAAHQQENLRDEPIEVVSVEIKP